MKLDLQRSSLVLAGAWNQAIFTPEWVAARVLEPEASRPPTGTVLKVGMTPAGGIAFEFWAKDATIAVVSGRVELRPRAASALAFEAMERYARRILSELPQTPVAAFGVNCAFNLPYAGRKLGAVVSVADANDLVAAGSAIQETTVVRRLAYGDHTINITISQAGNEPVHIDLNHTR